FHLSQAHLMCMLFLLARAFRRREMDRSHKLASSPLALLGLLAPPVLAPPVLGLLARLGLLALLGLLAPLVLAPLVPPQHASLLRVFLFPSSLLLLFSFFPLRVFPSPSFLLLPPF